MNEMNISIALCTCNGELYLRELLESLAGQTHVPFELVVCDDVSTDSTCAILDEFAGRAPFPVRVYSNTGNLGVIKNFEQALSLCRGNYIALCDQDDVWLPQKLARLGELIQDSSGNNGDVPGLVYSDMALVDADLKPVGKSYVEHQGLEVPREQQYRTLLVQNYIPGCSMLFSANLLSHALPFPDEVVMHDWWLALIAALTAAICFDPSRSVLYRQHGDNQLGSASRFSIRNLLSVITVLPALVTINKNYRAAAAQASAAAARLTERGVSIPADARAYVASLSGTRLSTLAAVLAGKVSRANVLRNITLLIAVMTASRS